MVEDWGTKYNITSNMMTEGIRAIHEQGGKVVLAYGGIQRTGHPENHWRDERTGITAQTGGGDDFEPEVPGNADYLANRIYKNILDSDFLFVQKKKNLWTGFRSSYTPLPSRLASGQNK